MATMGLKEAVDLADRHIRDIKDDVNSPRINLVKTLREVYARGAADGIAERYGENDETELETLNDENADLRMRLAAAEARVDALIETLHALTRE